MMQYDTDTFITLDDQNKEAMQIATLLTSMDSCNLIFGEDADLSFNPDELKCIEEIYQPSAFAEDFNTNELLPQSPSRSVPLKFVATEPEVPGNVVCDIPMHLALNCAALAMANYILVPSFRSTTSAGTRNEISAALPSVTENIAQNNETIVLNDSPAPELAWKTTVPKKSSIRIQNGPKLQHDDNLQWIGDEYKPPEDKQALKFISWLNANEPAPPSPKTPVKSKLDGKKRATPTILKNRRGRPSKHARDLLLKALEE